MDFLDATSHSVGVFITSKLLDMFGGRQMRALRATLHCNPLDKKNDEDLLPPGFADPAEDVHLKCYKGHGDADRVSRRSRQVEVEDQFGTHRLNVIQPKLLCQPARKELLDDDGGTPPLEGRAVVLGDPAGELAAGTEVCLDRIARACVLPTGNELECNFDHLHDQQIGILLDDNGLFPDPFDTRGEPCGYGRVKSKAGCGPDTTPLCL